MLNINLNITFLVVSCAANGGRLGLSIGKDGLAGTALVEGGTMKITIKNTLLSVLAMLGGCAIERAIAVEECTDFYENTRERQINEDRDRARKQMEGTMPIDI